MAERKVFPLLRPARIDHRTWKDLEAVVPDVALEERVTGVEYLIEAQRGCLGVIGVIADDPIVVHPRRVGERNRIELLRREFGESALRNLVAWKCQPGERIENRERDIRKIAAQPVLRRDICKVHFAVRLPDLLNRAEAEELVASNRSAQRHAILISIKARFVGLEVSTCIQRLVPEVLEGRPAHAIASRFGHHRDDRLSLTVLSGERVAKEA